MASCRFGRSQESQRGSKKRTWQEQGLESIFTGRGVSNTTVVHVPYLNAGFRRKLLGMKLQHIPQGGVGHHDANSLRLSVNEVEMQVGSRYDVHDETDDGSGTVGGIPKEWWIAADERGPGVGCLGGVVCLEAT